MLLLLVLKEFNNKDMVIFLFRVFDSELLRAKMGVFYKSKEFEFRKFLILALEAF